MVKIIETEQKIKGELQQLYKEDNEAQRALWQETSLARREGRMPDPKFARAWVATGDAIAALRAEHGIHRPRGERNEFYFDPKLAFSTGPPRPSDVRPSKIEKFKNSHFHRHP